MGCDCIACVAAEPAPSSDYEEGDAGAAALKAIDFLLARNRQVLSCSDIFHHSW